MDEAAVRVELVHRMADRDLDVGDARAHRREDLAELGLRPHGAEGPGRRADDRDRLPAQRVLGERPRDPVERVLELAGDRRVVLGRREEERVGAGDRRA